MRLAHLAGPCPDDVIPPAHGQIGRQEAQRAGPEAVVYASILESMDVRGRTVRSAAEALDPGQERVRYFRQLWPYLVGLCILLLLLDVLLRRVRLLGYRPLSL